MPLVDALLMTLWRNALAAIPLAIVVLLLCRCMPLRASTRHALWLVVLSSLLLPPILPQAWRSAAVHAARTKLVEAGQSLSLFAGQALAYGTTLFRETRLACQAQQSPHTVAAAAAQECSAPAAFDIPCEPISTILASKASQNSLQSDAVEPIHQSPLRCDAAPPLQLAQINEAGPVNTETRSQHGPEPRSPQWLSISSAPAMSANDALRKPFQTPLPKTSTTSPPASPSVNSFVQPRLNPTHLQSPLEFERGGAIAAPRSGAAKTSPAARPRRAEGPVPQASLPKVASGEPVQPAAPLMANRTSAVDGGSAKQSAASASIDRWAASLAAVRDAIVRIPPLPMAIWIGGMAVMALVSAIRILRFRRMIARGQPASDETLRMVSDISARMSLRSVPRTVMIDRTVPPMIWCGRTLRLILPIALWDDLDHIGRRAVIAHELAHLKRRDHWVCWVSAVLGVVYWWHPVVWWCRRRLREEADFCCDTWVTTLLPRARRAYAQALLTARTSLIETGRDARSRWFTNGGPSPMPAVGLGMTTPRAKRFARRLTMVMTNQTGPRMSRWGFACVGLLGMAAWLAAPLWACPPEDCESTEPVKAKVKVKAPAAPSAPKVMAAPRAPVAPRAPRAAVMLPRTPAPPAEADASTFERHMAERERAPRAGGDVNQRLDHLEHRLDRLSEQIERLMQQNPSPLPRSGGGVGGGARAPFSMNYAPGQPGLGVLAEIQAAQAAGGASLGSLRELVAATGETEARTYGLSGGKLQALTDLMARSDVPILIERKNDGIVVHATPGQHRIFGAFVQMIDPDGDHASREPIVGVMGLKRSPEERRMLEQEMAQGLYRRAAEQQALQAERMGAAAMRRAEVDAARAQAEAMRRQGDRIRQQGDSMRKRAEELRQKSDELRNKSSEAGDNEAMQRDFEAQAEAIDRQAEEIDEAAAQIDEQASEIDEQAAEMDEQACEAEEALASLEEYAIDAESLLNELQAEIDAELAELNLDISSELESPESVMDIETPAPPSAPAAPAPASPPAPSPAPGQPTPAR